MAVFEGVLDEISGGMTMGSPAHSGMSSSEQISALATQGANMTHREFLVIDGKRIMDVQLSNRHDALLVSSLGQRVRLSALKRGKGFTVMGVKLADGTVDKMGMWGSVMIQSVNIFLPTAFMAIVGFVGYVIGNPLVMLVGFGIAALFVRMVVSGAMKMSSARAEL